ncbi:hypothetical protein [Umezakia ovalisporum]|jgi:hypothetical protein|uniref:Uncharacterized protein n=2 Tax=Umezakia ovalisporum TaxID=75695 RepID=A0AA43KF60_9CYAN|nr:hypothetical protein [Umezakia ovalisporum]MBI1240276.1 hypothetical protein [Nostoc sp. RI_552]MDH6057267.1 hypothetical protein [Umezakia ovalisporum FSS-43]MDH6063613.1 hypothetical protein [Umezakia ovalisporum FSS-62]MDH6068777.1 hypothetical protein [Umezakia ovalisporum APH033B]MDH6070266.1 hypothetical protein [Umezakia ovalisporum CobakiLakeA]
MIHIENHELLRELTAEVAAYISGGQENQQNEEEKEKFNQEKYVQALGTAYLSPPGMGEITDDEALLAQYIGWSEVID